MEKSSFLFLKISRAVHTKAQSIRVEHIQDEVKTSPDFVMCKDESFEARVVRHVV